MWRKAQDSDLPAIESYLYDHIQSSMFPLGNLRNFGLNGPHPRSMSFWLSGEPLRGVFGITNEGMILPQCPDLPDQEIAAVIELIHDRPVIGVIGDAMQVRQIIRNAGWQGRAAGFDDDEPAFSLDLAALILPKLPDSALVPLAQVDRDVAVGWRRAYLLETPGLITGDVDRQARNDVERYLQRDSHRVLLWRDQPVAMTGFNAMLPEVVQIGGVYTPRDLRRRGYARTAVAMHLSEVRAAGVRRAVLFAASIAAARAYIAIGFTPAGTFSLVLFND